ncbi:magnesium chelatase subunit D family protein [Proteiniborus sp. MB09-C3]|uniref:magnesium chelatase subunit D family protein n=1 Tax=Proteiniborus sp. MB09-C3 TaxID=3050072 RepID=UPI0025562E06|nr:magnesium chelatase subunit D family protein [Proteiniborus sp. MB09-C3]WIV11796.1 magnesium chelatase subunit D family protein [Proteiniborus sp. MB09-C3]
MNRTIYPFTAIVGQEKLKKAILLNLVNPRIGGVLISGEKGTGKSTIVRSIPSIFNSVDIIDLPLNITEDRLIGSIDLEKAILFGNKELDEGILKKADGNILYIDEVNLLGDSIINTILQVSSSGFNNIEREGISYKHSSRFVLIGTMNPEEGSLKSIFLDKFGLFVSVEGEMNLENRKEIIRRRLLYEGDKENFHEQWLKECIALKDKIENGKKLINQIKISKELLNTIISTLDECGCEGNRTEIIAVEAVKAIAALDNRIEANIEDIKEAFGYVLPHRMRKKPRDREENKDDANNQENSNNDEKNENKDKEAEKDIEDSLNDFDDLDSTALSSDIEVIEDIGHTFKTKNIQFRSRDRKIRKGSGKRSVTKTDSKQGRYIRYMPKNSEIKDIALDGTLRAAAPYQKYREKNGVAIAIDKSDLREKIREKRTGATIFFLVDASGSISAKKRMKAVKGAIMSLLTDAYEKRDKVSLIAFRKESAEVLLQTTRSVELAKKHLSELPSGGKTPLSAGMTTAYNQIKSQWIKDRDMIPLLVVISDGRANVSLTGEDPLLECFKIAEKIREKEIKSLVLDTESGFLKFGTLKELSMRLGGHYLSIEDLSDKAIYDSVRHLTLLS